IRDRNVTGVQTCALPILNLGSILRCSPRLGHYVFAFVFLVRLIALARLTSSPFFLPSGGDMHFYDDWARQILHGRLTDHFAFYEIGRASCRERGVLRGVV